MGVIKLAITPQNWWGPPFFIFSSERSWNVDTISYIIFYVSILEHGHIGISIEKSDFFTHFVIPKKFTFYISGLMSGIS